MNKKTFFKQKGDLIMENNEIMTIENENEVIETEATELVENEGYEMSRGKAMALGALGATAVYFGIKKGVPLVVKGAKKAGGKVKGFIGKVFKKNEDVIETDSKDVIEEDSDSNE
jgi:hypothetical protein